MWLRLAWGSGRFNNSLRCYQVASNSAGMLIHTKMAVFFSQTWLLRNFFGGCTKLCLNDIFSDMSPWYFFCDSSQDRHSNCWGLDFKNNPGWVSKPIFRLGNVDLWVWERRANVDLYSPRLTTTNKWTVPKSAIGPNNLFFVDVFVLFHSTAHPHCSTWAFGRGRHLPVDQAQRQQHHWWRAHRPEGGGVPHHLRKLGRDPRGGRAHLQTVALGPWCGVWDQGVAVQTRRRGDGTPRTAAGHQNQMRWYVIHFLSKLQTSCTSWDFFVGWIMRDKFQFESNRLPGCVFF